MNNEEESIEFIPIGLISTTEGIKRARLRYHTHPFDWLYVPSKTAYEIFKILLTSGINDVVNYMTTGYTYYKYLGNERFESVNEKSQNQINTTTGLGNSYLEINNKYKYIIKTRFEDLIKDIRSSTMKIKLLYSDMASPEQNYIVDGIVYGLPATKDLDNIYDLIYPINNNIEIIYFCWEENKENSTKITYVPFEHKQSLNDVNNVISDYLLKTYPEVKKQPYFVNENLIDNTDIITIPPSTVITTSIDASGNTIIISTNELGNITTTIESIDASGNIIKIITYENTNLVTTITTTEEYGKIIIKRIDKYGDTSTGIVTITTTDLSGNIITVSTTSINTDASGNIITTTITTDASGNIITPIE